MILKSEMFLLQFNSSSCDSVSNLREQIEDEISQLFVNFKHAYYMAQMAEVIELAMKRVIVEINDFSLEKNDLDRSFRSIKTEALQKVQIFLIWKFYGHQ